MNKKYLNGVLMILLIIIWGLVIYKYFGSHKAPKTNHDDVASIKYQGLGYNIEKDTFELKFGDRNPFGILNAVKKNSVVKKARIKPKTHFVAKKNVAWPNIIYYGYVKGGQSTTPLILIKIGDKLYRKRERETVNDLILEKTFDDSLKVSLNGEKKIIKKYEE